MNTQIIAIPQKYLGGTTLEDRILKLVGSTGMVFEEVKEGVKECFGEEDIAKFYFYMEFPGMKTARSRQIRRMAYKIRPGEHFELQFGRVLACEILRERHKINWKECELSNTKINQLSSPCPPRRVLA